MACIREDVCELRGIPAPDAKRDSCCDSPTGMNTRHTSHVSSLHDVAAADDTAFVIVHSCGCI